MGQPQLKVRMTSATSPTPAPAHSHLTVADRGSHLRPAFEDFLQKRYSEAFGARLSEHYPLIAAAGVRFAEDEPLQRFPPLHAQKSDSPLR